METNRNCQSNSSVICDDATAAAACTEISNNNNNNNDNDNLSSKSKRQKITDPNENWQQQQQHENANENYLDFEIAQLKFKLTLPEFMNDDRKSKKLLHYIIQNQMSPYYELVCLHLKWEIDGKLLNEMKKKNEENLTAFQNEIDYAEQNLGTIDIKEAYLNKANYLCKIGNRNEALATLKCAYENTTTVGHKLDNLFHCMKIGLFFNDLKLIEANLLKCDELIAADGADWHYRNCYRIYKGLYALAIRDFQMASDIFINSTSTFACTELISFNIFIKYTILSAILVLNRYDLKQYIIENGDVLQALNNQQQQHNKKSTTTIKKQSNLKRFLFAFYNSDFKEFFKRLADIEIELRHDMLLHSHYHYYVREMRIKAYDQMLSSYISVKLSYMAERFGVGEEFLEIDLYKFIAAKRLNNYKIDKIDGKIENNQENRKLEMYDKFIKQGDILLNRIQKLSRVIDI